MKRKHLLSIITVLILSLFLISVLGCGGEAKTGKEEPGTVDTEETEPETAEPETEEPESEEVEETAAEAFRVGDTVSNEKYNITLNSAQWALSDGSEKPDQGKKWLAVSYTIENKSDIEFSVSRLINFYLYDNEGNASDIRLFADSETEDQFLEEGQILHGEVVFIVKEEHRNWELVFNPDAYVFPNPGLGKASFEITEDDIDE